MQMPHKSEEETQMTLMQTKLIVKTESLDYSMLNYPIPTYVIPVISSRIDSK